uniref:SET domain-containing protein n=1 Tax=Heterorhabditis bacteriophora TaxID=37862 RepID=A0A1I7WT03_HETBA
MDDTRRYMSLATKLRRARKTPPEGWDLIEPTLEEFEAKMREAETDPHEGKRRTETLWPIFRLVMINSHYLISKSYEQMIVNVQLVCFKNDFLRCIQTRDTNFGTNCICRVPKIIAKNNTMNHPEWSQLDPDERKSLFHKGLRVLSAKLMTNAHTIFFLNQIEQQNFHENKFIFVSTGIRKGEEVLDNYGASYYQHTKKERKAFLAERGFDCKCVACSSDESIDDLLGKAISHPEVVLKSLNNVGDFRKLRRVLPAGHKEIEMIAEMYIGAVGGDVRLLLLCVLSHYDIAASSDSQNRLLINFMCED